MSLLGLPLVARERIPQLEKNYIRNNVADKQTLVLSHDGDEEI